MPERTFTDAEYPCRKWPLSKRCDRRGARGFMGHTCVRSEISRLEGEMRGVKAIIETAEHAKANAESTITRMTIRIDKLAKELERLT